MTLPLFPLNTVLFPGCMLDLQIFEARYLDMVSRCMKQGQGFGVVCIIDGAEVGEAAGQFSAIGCEALIRDFEQRPNGLLGIRVEGGRRFRVQHAQVLPDQLTLAEVERRHIERVVDDCAGNKTEAARRLGVSRKTLERKFADWAAAPATDAARLGRRA